ncbi:1-phosphofructokinase [Lacticaseibacillus paracasei]|uniref:Tagatose-6-phosphate kinase n=1 Tax=Lacticaseibacillus paracasei TaxID=1597 RepID=A0ABD5D152_LACPA|nr:1-phosphofructokinase [Lacticaseibacillus paracasei]EPC96473.1 fructose-1-phosphate kinase [Lacticaseibacillus paracasei subsp. paracasei CNCM I-4649]MDR7625463.1 1-phosphofructokinase [Lacticaseibacillus paracasei]QPC12937.1 1-phosphofructokinase [Lacticaseibacillus paracasei subsp. tolerans]QUS98223.1 1-phosphofructokinase [Lacticaseibacillus paracasei subsp. tolerans]WMX60029.1 1-phosphofructokinase [Lacticaseibacillus paracasei]
MIYTLTLNPAIDLFIKTKRMKPNFVNRTESYDVQANGKGVNVSFILHRLGVENTALGVGGGFTLDYISNFLTDNGIKNEFFRVKEFTRINVFTRVEETGDEFKLVNPGPRVNAETLRCLWTRLESLTDHDWLCVSGSFAKGIDTSILVEIAKLSQRNGFKLIIDSSYPMVKETFKYHPFLIKPNDVELAEWYNYQTHSISDIEKLAKRALNEGAQNVLVSLGESGALFMNQEKMLLSNAPKIKVLNTAGAGDSMLGTFIAGLHVGLDLKQNLINSVIAGSDTARSSWLTEFDHTDDLESQITVTEVRTPIF